VTLSECCFCSASQEWTEARALTFVVASASRVEQANRPTQQLWCHAECLQARLARGVPFDADAFDD
jgi:hypothetical protein